MWKWSLIGDGEFTIEEATESDEASTRGMKIVMYIKSDDKYLMFKWGVEMVLKKYSLFVVFLVLLNGYKMNDVGAFWMKDEKDIIDDDFIVFYCFVSGVSDMLLFCMLFKVDVFMMI